MPTVAVLADPPVEGAVLGDLVDAGPLTAAGAAELYAAMLGDVCEAVQHGVGELLVNYRPAEQVGADIDSRARLEAALADELPRPTDARYEVQVGQTFAGRVGNTATHLLEAEAVDSVVALEPTAAFVSRETLGTVGMRLRTRDAVVGPTTDGRAYLAGFSDPIDFGDAYAEPAVETLGARARDAELEVDFAPMLPVIERPADLVTAVSQLRARVNAGRNVPPRTATFVADHDLQVVSRDGELSAVGDGGG